VGDPVTDAAPDGDGEVGDGVVDEGAGADGDGRGCGCRGRPGPLGRAVHLTWTIWGAEAGGASEMSALPASAPRVTVTVSVTLCPAWSVPA
jgi:hypothetical protein